MAGWKYAGGISSGCRAQAIGGIMAVGATIGLGALFRAQPKCVNIGRRIAAGHGQCRGPIHPRPQTDLFTTGVFAVSFYLWLMALRARREFAVGRDGGLGWRWAPKAPYSIWRPARCYGWRGWRGTIGCRGRYGGALYYWLRLGSGYFALPGFVRNYKAYGNGLGPDRWVKKVQPGFDSISGQLHKVYWNLTSALAQNFDPQVATGWAAHNLPDGRLGLGPAAPGKGQLHFSWL